MYALVARYVRISNSMKALSQKILVAHESERKRLAREIHDGVAQSLSAIKLNLQMMEAKAKEGVSIGKEVFPDLISEVSGSIEELKNVAMDIRPSFLEDMEISDIFRWYSRKFQETSGIEIKVNAQDSIKIDSRVKENLYRIYQEALSNAIKHSNANCIEVTLKLSGNRLSLEIKDNGKGFDYAQALKSEKGLGLFTMNERVELLGGIFRVKSSEKDGTAIYVEVPVG